MGFSTHVTMRLAVGELSLPVAQSGDDFLILAEVPPQVAPTAAELIIEVNGIPGKAKQVDRQWMWLSEGLCPDRRRVPIEHHGGRGNANAAKDDAEKATATVYLRVKKRDKERWMKAAGNQGLTQWIVANLNAQVPD